jgi:putative FmdB family regulatory protein
MVWGDYSIGRQMPTYEYECRECETKISEVRSINDPEPTHTCTKCGNNMKKIFNLGAVTFNGSGFYSKDK